MSTPPDSNLTPAEAEPHHPGERSRVEASRPIKAESGALPEPSTCVDESASPSPPLVVALILNWNGYALTRRCIAELNIPYLVADNGSTDGSGDLLAAELAPANLLRLPANLGFASGLNRGLELVKGARYVLLLNNDAELAPDTVDGLVKALERDPTAVAAAPTLYNGSKSDGKTRGIWFAGGTLSRWTATVKHHHTPSPDTHTRRYLSACCLLLRTEALEAVGGLPEGYFLYFEDVELCERLTRAGGRLLWVGSAIAWHLGGASIRSDSQPSPAQDYYDIRNSMIFMRRRLNRLQQGVAMAYLLIVRLPRKILRICWSAPHRTRALKAVLKGLVDGFSGQSGPYCPGAVS